MGILGRVRHKVIGEGVRQPPALDATYESGRVLAPATGELVAMEDIPDAPFAAGLRGEAVGIWPDGGVVYAPVTGTVTQAMSHALVMETDDGLEVLVHVGVDVVEMRGEGFHGFCRKGDVVGVGECLLTFDRAKVAKAGHPDIVVVSVAGKRIERAERVPAGAVRAGEPVLAIVRHGEGE